MTYRVRNIFVAVALAVVAALLTTFYVANYKRHVRQSESTVQVFVAKSDIPAGTSGAEIAKRHLLSTTDVAQRTVVPGAISDVDQVRNLVVTQPLYAREQVTLRHFAGRAQQGVRAQLHGTLRAIQLPGDPNQLLLGTLRAGDHVDVVATWGRGKFSRNVARDLLVLTAPQGGDSKTGLGGASVLLAANDRREVQKVWWAVKQSDGWALQLRPVSNAVDSPEDVEGFASMFKDSVNAANLKHYREGSPK